jgi:hypothetical protein
VSVVPRDVGTRKGTDAEGDAIGDAITSRPSMSGAKVKVKE